MEERIMVVDTDAEKAKLLLEVAHYWFERAKSAGADVRKGLLEKADQAALAAQTLLSKSIHVVLDATDKA